MKVLLTGMNRNQCTENFYLRQQLKVVPSHPSLLAALRDMGHEVVQREVTPGEDLSEYDEVIVYLATPRSLTGTHFYNGLWAISQHPKCILAFDDWQIDGIYDGIMSCVDQDSLFKDFTIDNSGSKFTKEFLLPYATQFMFAIDVIRSKSNRMLMSAFSGGDLSLLIDYPSDRLFQFNPNPYHVNRRPNAYDGVESDSLSFFSEDERVQPLDKEFKFNFASLVQGKTQKWLKQQKIQKWEIEFFGSKKDNQVRLTEPEMCRIYAKHWGCLMPGYFHAGSGWWRARPLQVADAGSILIGEYKEMILYYKDEHLARLKASDLEAMDLDQLVTVAESQKEALYSNHPLDKNVEKMELQKVLESK